MIRVSIVGASGYAGGELLRLLLAHPEVEISQVTSQRMAGKYIRGVHPNLRGATMLKFSSIDQLEPCDLLFLALPHTESASKIETFASLADRIIDLSADFRLSDADNYQTWYGQPHPHPAWLEKFVYGLPELYRDEISAARFVSGVGCNATAVNLALYPLARENLIEQAVIEVKVGSSESGNRNSPASHHPERSGCVRSFAPVGHRHQAEITQVLGDFELHFSATAIERVRGILCTAHLFLKEELSEKDVWAKFRQTYGDERFVRLVRERKGIYRYPEPKLVAGTNFCDIGFAKDPGSNRLVVISALDNLMKGASGSAVQAMNLMFGWPEETTLTFQGLHP